MPSPCDPCNKNLFSQYLQIHSDHLVAVSSDQSLLIHWGLRRTINTIELGLQDKLQKRQNLRQSLDTIRTVVQPTDISRNLSETSVL